MHSSLRRCITGPLARSSNVLSTGRFFSSSASKGLPRSPITLSPLMINKVTRNVLADIDLIVYDMAGTTVQEGGIVYKTLQSAMVNDGLKVSDEAMHPWHGAKKEAVIEHFAREAGTPDSELEARVIRVGDVFLNSIEEAYFAEASPIGHVDVGLMGYFRNLKNVGIKIGFDTGYPPNIQEQLIKRLGFDVIADAYISSYQVTDGRPFPYMIHHLMEKTNICDVKRVCKVGDSVRDIEEGRNAGCGLVVGVLSGADSYEELMGAGADLVCEVVTDLPVPRRPLLSSRIRLPDLS
eukprot:TRINITY_DN4558_c0_g1_i1.p1 TRINITY_DN4558_c0_g1~~TRINITY_DN4558_c0_g1_i1.p1  ORF type:complete len:294 (+),score=55.20 TRINITY_DN4558_c0_g1_i1:71-952(+)